MRINLMLLPTLILAGSFYWAGMRMARARLSPRCRTGIAILALLAGVPGLLFAAYYLHLWREPLWLYWMRSLPGSELAAAGAAFGAGWIHRLLELKTGVLRQFRLIPPVALLGALLLPYAKPALIPLNQARLRERWSGDVCLQSTPSTCGPSCAATLLRRHGVTVTERELAAECFTSASGTENWYLKRALERRGMLVRYLWKDPQSGEIAWPAIAGVRLGGPRGTGHYITVLGCENGFYQVGDPLAGSSRMSEEELFRTYYFTGFFMTAEPGPTG